jgi:hypothetical protein
MGLWIRGRLTDSRTPFRLQFAGYDQISVLMCAMPRTIGSSGAFARSADRQMVEATWIPLPVAERFVIVL